MGLAKNEVLFLCMMAFLYFSMGATVYNVGDSAGWTIIGNVDYNKWASSKTFQVHDTLLFKYDPLYHNVLQVSRSDFHSCDSTAPITTYSTGNDTISIRSPGHYYFICGFVGHCQAGQKVDIRVAKVNHPSGIPIGSPVQGPLVLSVPQVSPVGSIAPSPSLNSGKSILCYNMLQWRNIGLFLIFFINVLF